MINGKYNEAYLQITTWTTFLSYASHYYGRIDYFDNNDNFKMNQIEIESKLTRNEVRILNKNERLKMHIYKQGELSERFSNRTKLITTAKKTFQELLKPLGYKILFLSDIGVCDPRLILEGPRIVKQKCNELCEQFESYNGWGCSKEEETEVQKICDEWDKLLGRKWK